jgi:hypothetical protein
MRIASKPFDGKNKYQGIVSPISHGRRGGTDMKGIAILLLVLLAGCGTYTPMEQLEADAFQSGDWSLVEQRERINARRDARRGPQCPDNMVSYCVSRFGQTNCQCVSSKVLRSALTGR